MPEIHEINEPKILDDKDDFCKKCTELGIALNCSDEIKK